MRSLVSIILALTAIVAGASAGDEQAPRYQDFAVTNVFKGKPAAVDLSSHPEARSYRTELRRQAAEGPNFARHYKLAIWGCGSSCQQFAIVDSQTGRVYFPPELPYVTYVHWYGDDVGLQFRLDSRLLILHGSPKEEPRTGTFYYVWQTNTLRLIHVDFKKESSDEKPAA
jgi:hypothetical protein